MDTKNKTTLVIMAAGMGSRFGGLKQVEPVGENGQAIIDYSLTDAKRAGFDKACIIIKKAIEKDFREIVGKRIEKIMDVDYAFQEFDECIPEGIVIPEERVKPLGTAHAILCAGKVVNTPFAVINADDYYGIEAYKILNNHLKSNTDEYAMVAYELAKTVTANGTVSRGVCQVKDGYLTDVTEFLKIDGNCRYTLDDGNTWSPLSGDTPVSMNMWGFKPDIFNHIENRFGAFLKENITNLKSEYLLPVVVDQLIKAGEEKVKVLTTPDKWYGITYKEDLPEIKAAIKKFTLEGLYE